MNLNPWPVNSPFNPDNASAYQDWRAWKLTIAPRSAESLLVPVRDIERITPQEHESLLACCRSANMVIYRSNAYAADKNVVHRLGHQFGLDNLDANWLAGEDGVSDITVGDREPRQSYIPYTNRPIKWHTDGYYNPPERCIRGMVLHCVRKAARGGENQLMDHEIAYLLLRDENPEFVRALSAPDAMTIPERMDEDGVARPAQTGPVFSADALGNLHMRYTARTRSIEWKQDELTRAAVAYLEHILASPSPFIFHAVLEPGMGLLCNNVLHDRSGFDDESGHPRLLYRARYLDRIAGTGRVSADGLKA